MKHLLLVAHGSRRAESNAEIAALAARMQSVNNSFAGISHAFLELAEPSIPAALETCIAAGSDEVVILPYFLAAGRHVHEDIPEIVATKQAEHPQVRLRMTAHFGTAETLPGLLLQLAGE